MILLHSPPAGGELCEAFGRAKSPCSDPLHGLIGFSAAPRGPAEAEAAMAREFYLLLLVIDHALRHRGLRPVGRLEIAVDIEAGTGGDELADDDVLLQADQMV